MRGPARRGRQKIGGFSPPTRFFARSSHTHNPFFLPLAYNNYYAKGGRKEKRKEQKIAPPPTTSKRERESAQKNTEKERGEERGREERGRVLLSPFFAAIIFETAAVGPFIRGGREGRGKR